MLLPRWFPFHLAKVSYWSRTVIVPLLILMALKPQAQEPARRRHPRTLRHAARGRSGTTSPTARATRSAEAFIRLDRMVRAVEPRFPRDLAGPRHRRRRSTSSTERLNGEDGLGAIFPAMANAVMAFDALGYAADDPAVVTAKRAVEAAPRSRRSGATTHCQPCLSPVWDTALAMHAMMEAGEPPDGEVARRRRALAPGARDHGREGRLGLEPAERRPERLGLPVRQPPLPGHRRHGRRRHGAAPHRSGAARARRSSAPRAGSSSMQSADGGWGAFDADNTKHYLNHIPFADHGALLDPPTVDVTARCVGFLTQIGYGPRSSGDPARRRLPQGASRSRTARWFGRWGANYVYGTWSALCALNAVGERPAIAVRAPRGGLARSRASARTAAGARTSPPTGSTAATRPRLPRRPRPPGRCSA